MYEEEVLPTGLVLEDKTAAFDENLIMIVTVYADENFDADENLSSVDDAPPAHFISKDDLEEISFIDLKENINA